MIDNYLEKYFNKIIQIIFGLITDIDCYIKIEEIYKEEYKSEFEKFEYKDLNELGFIELKNIIKNIFA